MILAWGCRYIFDVPRARRFGTDRAPLVLTNESAQNLIQGRTLTPEHIGHIPNYVDDSALVATIKRENETMLGLLDGGHRIAKTLKNGQPCRARILTVEESLACLISVTECQAPAATSNKMPERAPSEPDNTWRHIPKSAYQEHATSMQPRNPLMLVQTPHLANLQRVLFNTEADAQMRRNALRQLQINVKDRDCEESRYALAQWQESGLTLE